VVSAQFRRAAEFASRSGRWNARNPQVRELFRALPARLEVLLLVLRFLLVRPRVVLPEAPALRLLPELRALAVDAVRRPAEPRLLAVRPADEAARFGVLRALALRRVVVLRRERVELLPSSTDSRATNFEKRLGRPAAVCS
jgi:hypothetical protein